AYSHRLRSPPRSMALLLLQTSREPSMVLHLLCIANGEARKPGRTKKHSCFFDTGKKVPDPVAFVTGSGAHVLGLTQPSGTRSPLRWINHGGGSGLPASSRRKR